MLSIRARLRGSIALLAVLVFTPVLAEESTGFGFAEVVEKARERAKQSYQPPREVPQFLQDLSYNQYQEIRFKPEASLWQSEEPGFEVMTLTPGIYYRHAVTLNQVDAEGSREIPFRKHDFNYPSEEFAKRVPADLGYAGFRITYPLREPDIQSQFLVFAGASYFRGVGSDHTFGVSGRGIAVNTGLPSGEEFPNFVEYWLVRPEAGAETMEVYGLLDGPSVTGAYRFRIHPGEETSVTVTARLFPRNDIELLGIAPLTSMFYYGENTPRPLGEWRPQVHDSDGLLVHDGATGEWLWRPLINPRHLRMSHLQAKNLGGFGLLQRNTEFTDFQDIGARYHSRPSAWVETEGDWGAGEVVLVEIPTRSESNDNIVAFWQPDEAAVAGEELGFDYTISFGDDDISGQPTAFAINTFVGDGNRLGGGNAEGALRLVVDFEGGPLAELEPTASVVSDVAGPDHVEILEHFVEYLAPVGRWRLSMLVRPAPDRALSLRAFLSLEGQALTETWTYELPSDAEIRQPLN